MNKNWIEFLRKLPSLFFGLFLFALGVVMNLYSNLGMSPWGVFQVGVINYIPMTLGQISQVVGLLVLIIGWALGFPPGFATLMNMYFVGFFIDLIMEWGLVPMFDNVIGEYALLLGSILMLGIGSYFYMRPRLGAGPRDGLMMGFVQRLDKPVSQIRGVIEITVLVIGYLLGGPVGVGTIITAFFVGYSVQFFFRVGHLDRKAKHMNLFTLVRFLQGKDGVRFEKESYR
ncbi:MAG: membrane protein [Candidatus Bathyarchaeota archaeon]|nr:membrane protein [Candidatus Bathyarchaeota archaeon]